MKINGSNELCAHVPENSFQELAHIFHCAVPGMDRVFRLAAKRLILPAFSLALHR